MLVTYVYASYSTLILQLYKQLSSCFNSELCICILNNIHYVQDTKFVIQDYDTRVRLTAVNVNSDIRQITVHVRLL